ncbi:MAG: MACPF domain-containing protein [Leptospirales bacterium]|nr:MACPF domain-containing protein [Leptospirales bacterium]
MKNTSKVIGFVLAVIIAAAFTGCNSDETDNNNDGTVTKGNLPDSMSAVLGRGYDITGNYADWAQIKPAILDLDKLLEDKKITSNPNAVSGQFETITGETISSYQSQLSVKVSVSAKIGVEKVASFSSEVGTNFGSERAQKSENAFATTTFRVVNGAYIIENSSLSDYLSTSFTSDLNTLSNDQLIAKYGTHVMLGGVMGARLDQHIAVEKKSNNTMRDLEAYAKANAEATIKGVTVGVGVSSEVATKYQDSIDSSKTNVNTRVFGGLPEYAMHVHQAQDYSQWIDSIQGNSIWSDYYPNSLVPICDLITDPTKAESMAQAILAYCDGKNIVVTAETQKTSGWFWTERTYGNNTDTIRLAGNGDISSGGSKEILWELTMSNLSLINQQSDGTYSTLRAEFIYWVKENVSDWTTFQFTTTKEWSLGSRKVLSLDSPNWDKRTGKIVGKNDSMVDAQGAPWSNGVIRDLDVQVDGSGDDYGNIGFNAGLFVEFTERK